jgi:O-antigen/teichoic acid export membrane protein
LAVVLLAGDKILDIFGTRYRDAWWPLVIVAGGSAVSTMFAIAPYSLKFLGSNRLTLGVTAMTTVLGLIMAFALGQEYGASGVAIAYAFPLALLFMALRAISLWKLREYLRA